jgi:hypothetical protein
VLAVFFNLKNYNFMKKTLITIISSLLFAQLYAQEDISVAIQRYREFEGGLKITITNNKPGTIFIAALPSRAYCGNALPGYSYTYLNYIKASGEGTHIGDTLYIGRKIDDNHVTAVIRSKESYEFNEPFMWYGCTQGYYQPISGQSVTITAWLTLHLEYIGHDSLDSLRRIVKNFESNRLSIQVSGNSWSVIK